MLQALDFSLGEPRRAVVAGQPADSQTRTLLQAVHSVYQPNKVVLSNHGPVEDFARTLPEKDGPQVYVCTGTACQAPAREVNQVRELMN